MAAALLRCTALTSLTSLETSGVYFDDADCASLVAALLALAELECIACEWGTRAR